MFQVKGSDASGLWVIHYGLSPYRWPAPFAVCPLSVAEMVPTGIHPKTLGWSHWLLVIHKQGIRHLSQFHQGETQGCLTCISIPLLSRILRINWSCFQTWLGSLASSSETDVMDDHAITAPFLVSTQQVNACPTFVATPSHFPKQRFSSRNWVCSLYQIHPHQGRCAFSEISGVWPIILSSGVWIFRVIRSFAVRPHIIASHSMV